MQELNQQVVRLMLGEFAKQDEMWGDPSHDDYHTSSDWIQCIDHELHELEVGRKFLPQMIKVLSLSFRACESYLRKGGME
jgi:hypothetical protein